MEAKPCCGLLFPVTITNLLMEASGMYKTVLDSIEQMPLGGHREASTLTMW